MTSHTGALLTLFFAGLVNSEAPAGSSPETLLAKSYKKSGEERALRLANQDTNDKARPFTPRASGVSMQSKKAWNSSASGTSCLRLTVFPIGRSVGRKSKMCLVVSRWWRASGIVCHFFVKKWPDTGGTVMKFLVVKLERG